MAATVQLQNGNDIPDSDALARLPSGNARICRWIIGAYTFLWLLLGLACLIPAAHAVEINPAQPHQAILSGIAAHVEKHYLDIGAIATLPEGDWSPVTGEINDGYSDTPHWYRIALTNPTAQPLHRLLDLGYPLLDYIEFYAVNNGQIVDSWTTGDTLPFEHRPMQTRSFVFPLVIPAHTQQIVYLRVRTAGALQIPLSLWQEDAFASHSANDLAARAVFYGMMLVMAIYNFFLFFRLRERSYLYLSATVIALLLTMGGLTGFSFRFIYPGLPRLAELIILVMVPLSLLFLSLFAISFLALRRTSRAFYRVLQGCVVVLAACALGGFVLPYHLSTTISVYLAAPITILNMITGLYLWHRGSANARWYSLAWIALLIGVTAMALSKLGVFPNGALANYGVPLGATILIMVLSFALASRFNREREKRLKAQEKSVQALHRQTEMEKQLLYAASHSEISNLPNRTLFEHTLQDYLDKGIHADGEVAVVLLHLLRFDDVNKTLGYWNADALIRLIAERLNRLAAACDHVLLIERTDDTCSYAAHIEGVRFTFALAGPSKDTLLADINKVKRALSQPIQFMDLSLDLQFKTGCSFKSEQSAQSQDLLREAFIAFDQTDVNVNDISIYTPEMNPHSSRRLTLMGELRIAIDTDALELYFQPQVHLPSQSVAGFEALLRWTHPKHGFIPPDEFIPMAEQTGLIRPLTLWVLHHALLFSLELDKIHSDASVSVNISANNLLEPDFSDQIETVLKQYRVAPERLVLEVTETATMTNPANALVMLENLRRIGVRLSIDDFGTGYSSLAYIQTLPVQEIKLDRSFILNLDNSNNDNTIVRTTINMCHDLGHSVVAEGVENAAIVKRLKQLNCDYLQGYYIERPRDAATILKWLNRTKWQKQGTTTAQKSSIKPFNQPRPLRPSRG